MLDICHRFAAAYFIREFILDRNQAAAADDAAALSFEYPSSFCSNQAKVVTISSSMCTPCGVTIQGSQAASREKASFGFMKGDDRRV